MRTILVSDLYPDFWTSSPLDHILLSDVGFTDSYAVLVSLPVDKLTERSRIQCLEADCQKGQVC